MPRRSDIESVMVIGSGPIVIGQACEFDYSGTQACRVLRDEGLRVVLVNSNPATIMTDPEFADATYVEPITPEYVERIIAKERPDALLATLGGQTALNTAIALHASGVLERYGVELIGADVDAIERGENREKFRSIVESIGGSSARSIICHTMEQCVEATSELGYPVVVRPSFTMGGAGSGIAYDEADLERIAGAGLQASPTTEVLLEESIIGWKEYELELMRDKNDNVVVVCSIENVDPMGVHTGDSITVAPCLTLTDREYQHMRDVGIKIIRAVGVDTGGCNIQFAINPADGRMIVIEMNPRVSRSSALASKATGFPIAKIAARLAIGYTLDEIPNDITQQTPASFEPTLDYVVVKVPRFAFEKFPGADTTLTTTMKSVGEAMAIGRNFGEALNKALRSMERPSAVFSWETARDAIDVADVLERMQRPHDGRLALVQQGLWAGASIDAVYEATGIDPWFLDHICQINEIADALASAESLDRELLVMAKREGFSDGQVAQLRGLSEEEVREIRHAWGIRPVFKTVDTCAAEFEAMTPYHYSSYDEEDELQPSGREKVIILGSGPNRIGQGIEFDYSCVHAAMALSDAGFETIMINVGDGEQQPGNRLHGLRHLRSSLFRTFDVRRRLGSCQCRAATRIRRGRHRAARWPNTTRTGATPRRCRRPDCGHVTGRHPSRRRARSLRPRAGGRWLAGSRPRNGAIVRRGGGYRSSRRLSRARSPELCTRRARNGDRVRRCDARELPAAVH